MPFGRSLAPSMLHRHDGHAEAVARIGWCIDQHALGVITGEVGAGQDRRRPRRDRRAGHLPARGDLPAQPLRRGPRHAPPHRRRARAGPQLLHRNPGSAGRRRRWPPNTPNAAAPRSCSSTRRTCWTTHSWKPIRMLTNHDMDSGAPFAALLVGQPTLRHRLRLGVLAALDQRISVRYALAGMTAERHRRTTSPTTSRSPAGPTPCSAPTPSPSSTTPPAATPGRSTTSPINALTAAFARKTAIVDEKAARIASPKPAATEPGTVTAPTTTSPHRPRPRPQPAGGAFPHPASSATPTTPSSARSTTVNSHPRPGQHPDHRPPPRAGDHARWPARVG